MKTLQPLLKSTVVSINILHMEGSIKSLALAYVDNFMTKAFVMTKCCEGRICIANQQHLPIQYWF